MTAPDALPLADCKCGHEFMRHHIDGAVRLADECLVAACGCDVYRPRTTQDDPPTEETR